MIKRNEYFQVCLWFNIMTFRLIVHVFFFVVRQTEMPVALTKAAVLLQAAIELVPQ